MSTLVITLAGFWPHATAAAADQLLRANPRLRHVPFTGIRELVAAHSDAAHDGTAGALLVTLPETCEPDQFRAAWAAYQVDGSWHLGTLVTVVPADLVLDGLTDERPAVRGGPAIGDLVGRQLEQCDTLLLTGLPGTGGGEPEPLPDAGLDDWEAEQLRVLLRRIAPWATHRDLPDVRLPELLHPTPRPEPVAAVTRGLRGRAVGVHEPAPVNGVVSCMFLARRPFHPARLHEALDELTERVLRSRGHFWLASRPDLVMTWESAGGLSLGPVSGWLDGLPPEAWLAVPEERRLAAAVDWDPYYGDRHHQLIFVGVDLDPAQLHATLTRCLLTDEELSRGEDGWRRLDDPFHRAHEALPTAARTKDARVPTAAPHDAGTTPGTAARHDAGAPPGNRASRDDTAFEENPA